MYKVFDIFSAIFCFGLIAAYYAELSAASIILKTAASVCFLIAGTFGYTVHRDKKGSALKMLSAFLLSAIGDVLLALDKDQGLLFILGVASFAAAHVMFLITYCSISPVKKTDIIWTAVVVLGLLALLLFGNFEYHGLLPVLIGYTVIVSFMMIKALSLWRSREGREKAAYLIMAGGVLFLLSDVFLLFCLFGKDCPPVIQAINWIIYYGAQICLTLAFNRKELYTPDTMKG